MKKLMIGILVLTLSSCAFAGDMTADDVIAKYVEAVGGEKAIRGVETLFMKGSMFMQGTPLELRMYVQPPEKAYAEVSMNNMVMGGGGTDGTNAWGTQMGQTFKLEGEMAKQQMDQADMFPLLDYKKRGREVSYIGEATVKGKPAHKLQFVNHGDTAYFFFDAETFLLVKEESGMGSSNLTNYEEVDGIMWPHKMTVVTPQGQQMLTFDSIAVNPEVPDSLFVMPANAKPMPAPPGQAKPDSGK